jgi:hypothetical protein
MQPLIPEHCVVKQRNISVILTYRMVRDYVAIQWCVGTMKFLNSTLQPQNRCKQPSDICVQ